MAIAARSHAATDRHAGLACAEPLSTGLGVQVACD